MEGVIAVGVVILANLALWLAERVLRSLRSQEIRLHPYTTRKLAERRYRHFDDGKWVPIRR